MSCRDVYEPDCSSLPQVSHNLERKACIGLDPEGFFIRHPPAPHLLDTFITPDDLLFQTIHMGAAVVDPEKYYISIGGLVSNPYTISLVQLKQFSLKTITAFHECYGSPLKPPINNVWRIGNVTWTGIQLKVLLDLAQPYDEANFVWSDGLDYGRFGGVQADRYQKDLPISKALSPEVILAYEMNGKPLSRKRGGPVRLIVPGYFGTNSTKWLCRLSVQNHRAEGPFTTRFYNELDPLKSQVMRPVWAVEPNSIIVIPAQDAELNTASFDISGWAWSHESIASVHINIDDNSEWIKTRLQPREDFSWQAFSYSVSLAPGAHQIMARAISSGGLMQPLSGRRNHVHRIKVHVLG